MKNLNIDYEALTEYLKTKTYTDFQSGGSMVKGHGMDDIELFEMDETKLAPGSIIYFGQPFLVDAIGNDLSVCVLTRRTYRNPVGRVVRSRFIKTLIHDCQKTFGSPLNGYWMIPEEFLQKEVTNG